MLNKNQSSPNSEVHEIRKKIIAISSSIAALIFVAAGA
jgi:hypothetical protein